MPSVMAARWVGQYSGPIFAGCGPKYTELSLPVPCAGVSVVCNAVFRLTMSCCVPEIFAIKSRSCTKSRRNFDVWGDKFQGGRDHPNF